MKRLIFILSLAVAMISSTAFAQNGYGGGQSRMGKGQNYSGQRSGQGTNCMLPDLTEEQRTKIDDLRVKHLKDAKSLQDNLAEKSVKLQSLRTEDRVDMDEINDLIEEAGKVRIELAKKREAHRQEVRSLLTDSQRIFFDSHQGRGNRGGRGHHRGAGMHGQCRQYK